MSVNDDVNPESSATGASESEPKPTPEPERKRTGVAPSFESATAPSEQEPEEQAFVLTPELVEDEAIRGDFVIRWAVVLLAFLLGCTAISESQTLVHLRSGQEILSAGGIAPRTDIFSYTATDRPWNNVAWLFDLIAAGWYAVAGWTGLSILKAVLAGVAFWLVLHTSRDGVSTWWGSILAVLALLASYQQFTIQPQIITFLGLAALLFMLHRWRDDTSPGMLTWLPVLFLVWSNLDPRMFLGLVFLLLFAAGESLGRLFGRSSDLPQERLTSLWMMTGLSVVAAMVNQFHIHALLSPLQLYGTEYPLLRAHSTQAAFAFPLFDYSLWNNPTRGLVAGAVLTALAVLAMVLNYRNLSWGEVFAFLGLLIFAGFASHQFPPACLVAAVLGTLNAQQWYQETFRQEYTTDIRELAFSRGGRAVTVLSLFAIGFLSTSGRINGADGRRTGLGLDEQLATAAEAYRDNLADQLDDRPFHFNLLQGDLLIWVGQKCFADHRVGIYAGKDERDILKLLGDTTMALGPPIVNEPQSNNPAVWQAVLDRFEVTHVLPPVLSVNANYLPMLYLDISPYWAPTQLEALVVFYRTDTAQEDEALREYILTHRINFRKEAFEDEPDLPEPRAEWPREQTGWANYLTLPKRRTTNAAIRARHYQELLRYNLQRFGGRVDLGRAQDLLPLCILTLRQANRALSDDPDSALAYELKAAATQQLLALEELMTMQLQSRLPPDQRIGINEGDAYMRTAIPLTQAVKLLPENAPIRLQLVNLYRSENRVELMLRELRVYEQLISDLPLDTEANLARWEQVQSELDQLESTLAKGERILNDELAKGVTVLQLIQQVSNPAQEPSEVVIALKAMPKTTLLLIEDNLPEIETLPPNQYVQVQANRAKLLMESGRVQEAFDLLLDLEQAKDQFQWRTQMSMLYHGMGNYEQAIALLEDQLTQLEKNIFGVFQATPLMSGWPAINRVAGYRNGLQQASYAYYTVAEQTRFRVGRISVESGEYERAKKAFRELIEINPNSRYRPMAAIYLGMLGGFGDGGGRIYHPVPVRIRKQDPVVAPRPFAPGPPDADTEAEKETAPEAPADGEDIPSDEPKRNEPVIAPRPEE